MNNSKIIQEADGENLVKSARKFVTEYLKTEKKIELGKKFDNKFSFPAGVFVTLNHQAGLRGCIGYPLPNKKLSDALRDSVIAAATEDPRFPVVSVEELGQITIEVTILTPPTAIKVENPQDYPKMIKVGRDGLIVKSGFYSGLLLPQVPVEYGWDEKEFLDHTCEKAGLPKSCWKEKGTTILKFEGVVFKEETPNGKIVRVNL